MQVSGIQLSTSPALATESSGESSGPQVTSAHAAPPRTDSVTISPSFDDRIRQVVMTVYSVKTGRVIQEIPPAGIRDFAARIIARLGGSFEGEA